VITSPLVSATTRRRWLSVLAAIVALVLVLGAAAVTRIGLVGLSRDTGYFAPLFSPDGTRVFAVSRRIRALVVGLGAEFFTGPASVRLFSDRFALLQITLGDGQVSVVETFPPSPLEGDRIRAYHGAIFGTPHVHLRWADQSHLEYEIAVTRHDVPASRTFVIRKRWDPKTQVYETSPPWQEASMTLGGDEPQQLHGDAEVIAVPGDEMLPCAIALLHRDGSVTTLVGTRACRRKYSSELSAAVLTPISRRADIERAELIRTTYDGLIAEGLRAGRGDGQARLAAGKEMQRLGLFPKTPSLVAEPWTCETPAPVYTISDMEFRVGLFQDIEAAIDAPGTEVDKSMGDYIEHRDYATSRQLNVYINAGHPTFFIRARGECWRLTIHRP